MHAILIIWIGVVQSQTMSMTKFESMEDCLSARAALIKHDRRLRGDCVPYRITPPAQEARD